MPTGGTKVTIRLMNCNGVVTTYIYHATSAIDQTDQKVKKFTGYKDGQTSANAGALEVHLEGKFFDLVDQHHEAE